MGEMKGRRGEGFEKSSISKKLLCLTLAGPVLENQPLLRKLYLG